MAEIQQVHGHPTTTISFGVDDLVVAVAETAADHDLRHILGNIVKCRDTGLIVFVNNHSSRSDRQTHAHTCLDGFHVGFIQGHDVEQESTFAGGGLNAMIRFGGGKGGGIGSEYHYRIHFPVRQGTGHDAGFIAQFLDGFGDARTPVLGHIDRAIEITRHRGS